MDYSPYYLRNHYKKGKKGNSERGTRYEFRDERRETRDEIRNNNILTNDDLRLTNDRGINNDSINQNPPPLVSRLSSLVSNQSTNHQSPITKKRNPELIAVILIIVSFISVIIATEFFTGRAIGAEIGGVFGKGEGGAYYFLVSGEFKNYNQAEREAVLVANRGGAGYVVEHNNAYFVAIATYCDKKTANTVAGKNEGLFVIVKEIPKNNFKGIAENDKKLIESVQNQLKSAVIALNDLANSLEKDGISVKDALNSLTHLRNDFYELKAQILRESVATATKNKLIYATDAVFTALDSVITASSGKGLLAGIRYATAVSAVEGIGVRGWFN
ncbi:MAG: hypothetical protein FWD49_06510 [Firmicutes bacterium]|nr:hypothetical protein [Bacillota bacterium]